MKEYGCHLQFHCHICIVKNLCAQSSLKKKVMKDISNHEVGVYVALPSMVGGGN